MSEYQSNEYASDEELEAADEERQVHEEGQARRSAGVADFDNYDDAYADYQEKQARLSEAIVEANAAEQALPELRVALQQKKVDELKAQEPQYSDDGRLLGAPIGTVENEDEPLKPVALPQMYGGNPDPRTLRSVS